MAIRGQSWRILLLCGVCVFLLALWTSAVSAQTGTVWAWGDNSEGQLGLPVLRSACPGSVGAEYGLLRQVQSLSAGSFHSLALKTDGTVWAWGANWEGQLGTNEVPGDIFWPAPVRSADGTDFLRNITAIAAGQQHSLALAADGTVWAWGTNWAGQLGNGTNFTQFLPTKVLNAEGNDFLTDIVAIAAGDRHSLALKSDGTVWAWGYGYDGQLGIGILERRFLPVQVMGTAGQGLLSGIRAIAAGGSHSLALQSDGTVLAWGLNSSGQLGEGTNQSGMSPTPVLDASGGVLTGVIALSAGTAHSVALKQDGSVWAWGDSSQGQTGTGPSADGTFPAQVLNSENTGFLTGITAIQAGAYHTVALTENGNVWGWGNNRNGQLGDGTYVSRSLPTAMRGENGSAPLTGVRSLAASISSSLILQSDGSVYGTGGERYTQLLTGIGAISSLVTPVLDTISLDVLTDTVTVAAGGTQSLALKSDGSVWEWNDQQIVPRRVCDSTGILFLTEVVAVASGYQHNLAVRADGSVWAWGDNTSAQLGDGSNTSRLYPVRVLGENGIGYLDGIRSVSASDRHSLAVRADGSVWAWGDNASGQLGNLSYTFSSTPIPVQGVRGEGFLSDVIAVSAGWSHSLALKADGTVWAWGDNQCGQLGDGTFRSSLTPVQVHRAGGGFLTGVVAISAGHWQNLALKADGTVWTWGNFYRAAVAERGMGGVGFLTDVAAISCGYQHNLALRSDGTVLAWGDNDLGQLGDSTFLYNPTPGLTVNDSGNEALTSVHAVSAGYKHSLAVRESEGAIVSGTLEVEGKETDAPPQWITFTFRSETETSLVRTALIPASGAFRFTGLPERAFTLHIKAVNCLAINLNVDTTAGNISGLTAILRAGDANGDNSVDALDLAELITAFNTVPDDPDYRPNADFNGDNSVDALDLALLIGNFNTAGGA